MQGPSFSPALEGKDQWLCIHGNERKAVVSYLMLSWVWDSLGWWSMNPSQPPGKVLRNLPHLFQVPNCISQNEHPSLFFLLFIASFPLGYTVLRAFSLDSQEPVWKSRKTNIAFSSFILVIVQILLKVIWTTVFE